MLIAQHGTCPPQLHVETEEGDKLVSTCEVACSWLLTQASNIQVMHSHPVILQQYLSHGTGTLTTRALVQVLGASVIHLNSFGRARGIKHLLLQSTDFHCGRLSTALVVLGQLQTLWLNDPKGPVPQPPGALQLDALTALRTVALDGLVLESSLAKPAVCVAVGQQRCHHGAARLLAQGGQPDKGIIAGPSRWHSGCASAAQRRTRASVRILYAGQGSACHRARSCCLARRQPGSKQHAGPAI